MWGGLHVNAKGGVLERVLQEDFSIAKVFHYVLPQVCITSNQSISFSTSICKWAQYERHKALITMAKLQCRCHYLPLRHLLIFVFSKGVGWLPDTWGCANRSSFSTICNFSWLLKHNSCLQLKVVTLLSWNSRNICRPLSLRKKMAGSSAFLLHLNPLHLWTSKIYILNLYVHILCAFATPAKIIFLLHGKCCSPAFAGLPLGTKLILWIGTSVFYFIWECLSLTAAELGQTDIAYSNIPRVLLFLVKEEKNRRWIVRKSKTWKTQAQINEQNWL